MIDDMTIIEVYVIFRCDVLCWDIFMHAYLVIYSKTWWLFLIYLLYLR